MPRDDAALLDILRAASRAIEGLAGHSLDSFVADWRTQSLILHQLLILGEAVKRVSSGFKEEHPQIPWRQIAGLRDILIHRYDTVDLKTVWNIVKRDLPPLVEYLRPLSPMQE